MVALAALAVGVAGAAAADGSDALSNPRANLPPPMLLDSTGQCTGATRAQLTCASPCFPKPVITVNGSARCTALALSAVNRGRRAEHLPALVLPDDYRRLTVEEQLFVLVDLERTARGVPPLVGLTPVLTAQAQEAAAKSTDPQLRSAYDPLEVATVGDTLGAGGAWAGDEVDTLEALFGWIYDDGWGGRGATSNGACTSASAPGCWGHRDELLGEYRGTGCSTCVAGAGYARRTRAGFFSSYVMLVVAPANGPPSLSFSWDRDVLPHLPAAERVRS
jgi:hypothetical protein